MDALDLAVGDAVGIDDLPAGRLQPVEENCDLASRLARGGKSVRKAASLASHFNPAISLKSVVQPSPIASAITLHSAALAISSQRRGVTPSVLSLIAPETSREVLDNLRRSTANGWPRRRSSSASRRRPGWPSAPFPRAPPRSGSCARREPRRLGKRRRTSSRKRRLISKMISSRLGSDLLEIMQRPTLERLRQQRVIGEPGSLRDIPGRVPAEARFVEQDAHELGHRQGGVGIVELDGDLVRKWFQSVLSRRNRRTRSASEQATRKYSCVNRSSCPISVESSG